MDFLICSHSITVISIIPLTINFVFVPFTIKSADLHSGHFCGLFLLISPETLSQATFVFGCSVINLVHL